MRARSLREAPPTATVWKSTQDLQGKLKAFEAQAPLPLALTDANGWYRAWPVYTVKFVVNDPLQAHVDQLGKYTDGDMHDVFAYLQTLKPIKNRVPQPIDPPGNSQ